MNVHELTRALVDIESITENEGPVAAYLHGHLAKLAARTGGQAERMEVEPGRFNVLATWGRPVVTLSTHMDTVPPFFPSREDAEFIWGRGACDAKGIIAAMVAAAEKLLAEGVKNFALLFVVGEERNSAGAAVAAKASRGSKYLVNGEPTENKMVLASKGILRYEVVARGKMAHSAYPELGESAIETLLDALDAIRKSPAADGSAAGTVHDEHRHDFGRPRAQRDRGCGQGGNPGAAGRRCGADPRGVQARRRHARGTSRDSLHSADTVCERGWLADHGCIVCDGCSGVRHVLGRAAAARARKYPRGAHAGGAHLETGACGRGGNVRGCGKEAAGRRA